MPLQLNLKKKRKNRKPWGDGSPTRQEGQDLPLLLNLKKKKKNRKPWGDVMKLSEEYILIVSMRQA